MPGTDNRPDFRARGTKGHDFFVEVTVCTDQKDPSAEARLNDLRDTLDRTRTSDFWLDLRYEGLPEQPVPGSKVRKRLEKELAGLDVESIRGMAERGEWDALPGWQFTYPGIEFRISVIPTSGERDAAPFRSVGGAMGGVQILETDDNLRESILRKATRYGKPTQPFLVAVNAIGFFPPQSIDIFNALFGKEVLEITRMHDGSTRKRETRQPDGVWHGPNGMRNRRLSGVLVGAKVTPWTLASENLSLVTNPYSDHPYSCDMTALSRWDPGEHGEEFRRIEGRSLRSVFRVPKDWPEVDRTLVWKLCDRMRLVVVRLWAHLRGWCRREKRRRGGARESRSRTWRS